MDSPLHCVLAALEVRGCKPKKSGASYTSTCPAHDDRNPSLSVREGSDGTVLLKCHAGCPLDRIVSSAGLQLSDLFPKSGAHAMSAGKNGGKGPFRVVAEYEYRDRDGRPLFTVERREPKDFRQKRLVDGKWKYQVPSELWVPFHLPELLAADPSLPVYVVEGEKDVLACEARGLVATCGPCGALKFRESFASWFEGRQLVIVADDDPVGLKHAAHVRGILEPAAKSVRAVKAKTGKDAYDHFAAGHTADEFVEIDLAELPDDAPKATTLADIAEEKVDWLWEPYLPLGEAVLLAGDGGVGKTYLALALASAITTGSPLPGMDRGGAPASVLLVTDEDDLAKTVKKRSRLLGCDESRFHAFDRDALDGHDWKECVIREAKLKKVRLIILDPWQSFIPPGTNTNSLGEIRTAMRGFKRIARETGATVLLISHFNKMVGGKAQHRVNGSADLVNASRSTLVVGTVQDGEDEIKVLAHAKTNYGAKGPSWSFRITEDGFEWLGTVAVTADEVSTGERRSSKLAEAEEFLRSMLSDGPIHSGTVFDRGKLNDQSKVTLRRAFRCLGGKSEKVGTAWYWSLPNQVAQESPIQEFEQVDDEQVQTEPKQPVMVGGDEQVEVLPLVHEVRV